MWIKNSPSSVTVKYQSGRVFTASLKALSPPAALCEYVQLRSFFWSAFTCLKLTIETLEQGVKYVQS